MRPQSLAVVAFMVAGVLVLADMAFAERYEINDYRATFVLNGPGSAGARVRLEIEYDVQEGPKASGFKYTGAYCPLDVKGWSDDGEPVEVSVRRDREYRVGWAFPAVQSGRKHVTIEFTLSGVLSGTEASGNVLAAPWVGIFKVPVRRAEYVVVFPDSSAWQIRSTDGTGAVGDDGRFVWREVHEPLRDHRFQLAFSPGLVTRQAREDSDAKGPLIALAISGAFIALLALLNHQQVKAGGKSWFTSSNGKDGGWGGCGGGGCGGGCGG